MCETDYVTVMVIFSPVITELFTPLDAKMEYGNRFIKTELFMILVTDQLNAQILVL